MLSPKSELTQLYKAARAGEVEVLGRLVPRLNRKNPAEKEALDRALAQAVLGNAAGAVALLLRAGANPEQTVLIEPLVTFAAANGNLHIVKNLVEAGADVNRESKGETALSRALAEQQRPVIDYLESLGATAPPTTALFYACAHGDIPRAQRALAQGASLEKPHGILAETPLMVAARRGKLEAVKLLLQHGANPNTRIQFKTALFDAVQFGKSPEVFEALVAAGADLRTRQYDTTVLMAAAEGGALPIVKRLVELGADVHACDKHRNQTALDYAQAGKHTEVVAYLSSLGATSVRAGIRALGKALARRYGGKPVEHSSGVLLNAKLEGNLCQFSVEAGRGVAAAFKLRYKSPELRRAGLPGLMLSGAPKAPDARLMPGRKAEVKAASKLLGIRVWRSAGPQVNADRFIIDFCRRHKDLFQRLRMGPNEHVGITGQSCSFAWTGNEIGQALVRLQWFEQLIREISTPPLPERRVFEREWLLKPAPKTAGRGAAPHSLGGSLEKPVSCPHCGVPTNLMARIAVSDPALPRRALGYRDLPFFWCLNCLEWGPAFFDLSQPVPRPLTAAGKLARPKGGGPGENDLPERRAVLVPVPVGKKAGRKSKVGGSPNWIQSDSTPGCPKCQKPMAFALQLASDARIAYSDMGLLYGFVCPECKIAASLIQSH